MKKKKDDKLEKLILILNKMVEVSEPIYYNEFNKFFECKDKKLFFTHEEMHPEIGIANKRCLVIDKVNTSCDWDVNYDLTGISIVSIIATITDVLVGKRLGVILDITTKDKLGQIVGFTYL